MRSIRLSLALMVALTGQAFAAQFAPTQKISPAGEPPLLEEDYFSTYCGNPCDFDTDGDFERIVEFGNGVKDKQVTDGCLRFTTGEKDNYFYFGRFFYPYGPKNVSDENIGGGWPTYVLPQIRMRIKQSLPSSTWWLKCRYQGKGKDPEKSGMVRGSFRNGGKIEGTDWQEIVVPFTLAQCHIAAISFETDERDNDISIDYIRISAPHIPAYYRKKIVLDDDPVFATLRVNFSTEHYIYVNGQLAQHNHGLYQTAFNPVVDITRFLKKGENLIAIGTPDGMHHEVPKDAFMLICDGIALTKNGSFVSLRSDGAWKGSYEPGEDWYSPATDDAAWAPVAVQGDRGIPSGPVTYVGPLTVAPRGDAIFKIKDGMNVSLTLPAKLHVEYSLMNSFTKEETAKGVLPVTSVGPALEKHTLSYKPDAPGVWRLHLKLLGEDGASIDERTLEVAVVGPIPQKRVKGSSFTEGMQLTKVADIDCVNDADQKRFLIRDEVSGVVKKPFGAYRESEGNPWQGFGYLFSVKNLYRPHVIEVEYPDDTERSTIAKVFCARNEGAVENPSTYRWDWNYESRWHSGARTGGYEFPVSNTMKKFYLLFRPNGTLDGNCIQILSTEAGRKAAASRITIYEVDDLPALDIPDTPKRLFGMYVEREQIMPMTMYSGKYDRDFTGSGGARYRDSLGRMRDWYDATENLIKYLRFSGHNLYVPGYFMYTGVYFPETQGWARYGGPKPTDHFRLMASMFEENDLYLFLGCEYGSTPTVREKAPASNWEVQHKGKETVCAVSEDGRQSSYGLSALPFVLDYQHPLVEEDIMGIMKLYLEYGRDYKSFKGISFNTRNVSFPSLAQAHLGEDLNSSLAWGWQDSVVELFQTETGIRIPVAGNDPERFGKRHDYVLNDPRVWDKWMDFRCRRVHEQVTRVAEFVRTERPDCRLYINQVSPSPNDMKAIRKGSLRYDEGMRRRGFDKSLYTEPGIVNLPELGDDGRGMRAATGVAREQAEYWKDAEGFYLSRPGAPHTQDIVTAPPYTHWAYSLGMLSATPSTIVFSQADVQLTSGGEQGFRPFLNAFRRLPPGRYTTLHGSEIDEHVTIRRLEGKGGCWYLVNPYRFAVRVTLAFSPGAKLTDACTGEVVALKGKEATFNLAPYQMTVLLGSGEVVSAWTEAGDMAREFVDGKLPLVNLFLGIDAARAGELIEGWDPGMDHDNTIARLREVKDACDGEAYLKALDICDLAAMRKLYGYLSLYKDVKTPPVPRETYRVICGSSETYRDKQGREWLPDRHYVFGVNDYGYVDPKEGGESEHVYRTVDIKGTEDVTLYRSERYGMRGYQFLVPDGLYTVILHFAESFSGARRISSRRLFDIVIEGDTRQMNFEILSEADFMTALVKTFKDVKVIDGELLIEFPQRAVCSSAINAIEVIRQK